MLHTPNDFEAGPLPVELHRQNGTNHCGAACVQMIAIALGQSPEALSQSTIFEGGRPATPGSGSKEWFMSPLDMEVQFARVLRQERFGYSVRNFPSSGETLLELESTTAAGWPACLLGDGGAHWIVVHGTRRDDEGRLYLDIRDPWPPITGSVPNHADEDSMEKEFSSAWHIVFPAGLEFRVCPIQIHGPWYQKFVIVSSSLSSSCGESDDLMVRLPQMRMHDGRIATGKIAASCARDSASTRSPIRLSAEAGARMAASLRWIPLDGEDFVAGRMLRIKASDWCGKKFCPVRGEDRYLVELHRASDAAHILALAVVDSGSGAVLEMLAPASSRSWIQDGSSLDHDGGEEIATACGDHAFMSN